MPSPHPETRVGVLVRNLLFRGLAAAMFMVPASAYAQDVVVMRRTVAVSNAATHSWKEGPWQASPSCSARAPSTREVTCVRTSDDVMVSDSLCLASRKPPPIPERLAATRALL